MLSNTAETNPRPRVVWGDASGRCSTGIIDAINTSDSRNKLPFAAAGIGSLLGGWLSSRLIASGRSVDFSRKLALGL
jgi:hypothetical protein